MRLKYQWYLHFRSQLRWRNLNMLHSNKVWNVPFFRRMSLYDILPIVGYTLPPPPVVSNTSSSVAAVSVYHCRNMTGSSGTLQWRATLLLCVSTAMLWGCASFPFNVSTFLWRAQVTIAQLRRCNVSRWCLSHCVSSLFANWAVCSGSNTPSFQSTLALWDYKRKSFWIYYVP